MSTQETMASGASPANYTQGSDLTRLETHSSYVPQQRGQSKQNILSEQVVQREIVVPKRVVREEVIEKVFVVPETVVREEIIEEIQTVKETIIRIAKPVIQKKIMVVPEVEYRDKIVHVVEKVIEEDIKHVPKIEYKPRFVEVEKYVDFEGNEIEPPTKEYKEIIVEKIVEVPEVHEEVFVRELRVPQYVEKVITPQYSQPINIPVPVEAVTTYDYELQHPTPMQNMVEYPLYVPRFVEVPVFAEIYDAKQIAEMQATQSRLASLTSGPDPLSLSQIETLATDIRQQDFLSQEVSPDQFKAAITQCWKTGQLQMVTSTSQTPA